MARIVFAALMVTGVLAVAPAAGRAAAPWGAAERLPSAGNAIAGPGIGFSPAGAGFALYQQVGDNVATMQAGRPIGATAFGAGRGIGLAGFSGDFTLYGHDRVALTDRSTLRFGRPGGRFGRAHAIGVRAHSTGGVRIAGNGRGDLAIAAEAEPDHSRTGNGRIYLAVRRRGRAIPSLRYLSPVGRFRSFAVAMNTRGDTVVAWERDGRVEARVRTLGGKLTGVQYLGHSSRTPALGAAIGLKRRATVAWSTLRRTAGLPATDANVRVEVASAGPGGNLSQGRLVEAFDDRDVPLACRSRPLRVVQRTPTAALVAWSGRGDGRSVVRVVDATRFGPGPPQTFSSTRDQCLADIAAGPRGREALLVDELDPAGNPDNARAAVGTPGSHGLRPLEIVSEHGGGAFALAIDPRDDRPVALASTPGSDRLAAYTRAPIAP